MDIKLRADGTIPTVAVIGIIDNALVFFVSYPDDKEGNEKAQELFKAKIKSDTDNDPELNYDTFIEDGIYENSDISILLTHGMDGKLA